MHTIYKLFVLTLGLLSILCIPVFSVYAEVLPAFVKYTGNPLPFHPNYPGRVETGTYQPSVLYENGIFKLWYASLAADGFKLAYADSTDGITWGNYRLLPVPDTAASHNPSILHINNMYELYYTSDNGGLVVTKVTDDTSTRTVMIPEDPWEAKGIFAPHVSEKEETYTMFYTGWGNQGFRIGMATSSDGDTWHKCQNNPVLPYTSDGSYLYKKNGISYLFFHSENGIEYVSTPGEPTCESVWSNRTVALTRGPGEYDNSHMISPSLVEKNDNLYLYYSGLGSAGWTLNLATLLPVHEHPQTLPAKEPVVLIPGLFASWNKDAILHDADVPDDQWILTPFVKEYDGLIQTLENNGYIRNKDYYIYTYDWRKPVNLTTDHFSQYMSTNVFVDHPQSKIHLIGHSLGGLIGRAYIQNYQPHFNGTLVTAGTPHLGAAQAYKAIEAGEIETQNSYEWLAEKLILQLHRGSALTDREILQTFMPVVKDLLPVYPYIKSSNGNYLSSSQMIVQNDFLKKITVSHLPVMTSLGSNSQSTLVGYAVTSRSPIDKLLDLYPDGRPILALYDLGDGLVRYTSSTSGMSAPPLSGNHGEIIAKKDQIKRILESSGLSLSDDTIAEGGSSTVFPGLIGMIMSPARLTISSGTTIYNESDGLIYIPQKQPATYNVSATGTGSGNYTILLGALQGDETDWRTIHGAITPGTVDTYTYTYDPTYPWMNKLVSTEGSDQKNILITSIREWLMSHKRKIRPANERNPRELIHYMIHNQTPAVVLEALNYIEQIEKQYFWPHHIMTHKAHGNELKEMKTELLRAESEVVRSRTNQKAKALILIWLQKRTGIIDRISSKMPDVARFMMTTNHEVINTIR